MAERRPVRDRRIAESPGRGRPRREPVVLRPADGLPGRRIIRSVRAPLEGVEHLFDKVVDKEYFEFNSRIVYRNGEVFSDIIAEGCDGRIVVWSRPFANEVRKAIEDSKRDIEEEIVATKT